MRLFILSALVLVACSSAPPGQPPPPPDAGASDGGVVDGGEPIVAPASTWTWVSVDGSQCGSGARAGLGINPGSNPEELFIYLQGGGACWNTGTCVPSLQQFGPLCDYGQACLLNVAGGQLPTASHVTEADPFPADGGGAFPGEMAQLASSAVFARGLNDNPFRAATFVYVPYCTGDLHGGAGTQSYLYKLNLFDTPSTFTMHFNGARNMDAYLARLKATLPGVKRVWLTGASAGAFGATLNLERVRRAFPGAEVHLLADSGPFLETPHFDEWRTAWNLELPQGCAECDAGFPAIATFLGAHAPDSRLALLSYDQDKVISWYFYAPPGAAAALNPPVGTFAANLAALEARNAATANMKEFVVPGGEHVLFAGYGVVLPDGGLSVPLRSRDAGTDLRAWVNAWAMGDGGWVGLP